MILGTTRRRYPKTFRPLRSASVLFARLPALQGCHETNQVECSPEIIQSEKRRTPISYLISYYNLPAFYKKTTKADLYEAAWISLFWFSGHQIHDDRIVFFVAHL